MNDIAFVALDYAGAVVVGAVAATITAACGVMVEKLVHVFRSPEE